MQSVEKFLAIFQLIAGIGRGIYGQWHMKQLLTGIMMVAGLTIVTAMMIGALLIGGFYAAYLAMLHYGIPEQRALLSIGIILLMTTLAFILTTRSWILQLRRAPQRAIKNSPIVIRTHEAFDAFIDGLLAE